MPRFAGRIAAFALIAPSPLVMQVAMAQQAQTLRQETDLTGGWRFRFGADEQEAMKVSADDAGWQRVSLPHTWNRVGAYGSARPADHDNRQGVGWYRLRVTAPSAKPDQRQYLDFAGVSNIAEIWVNGMRIGEHRGAYTRFRFDVTHAWKPGAVNLVAVRADNTKPAPGSSTADVLPLSGDFFVFGGIYRGVKLIQTGPVGFDLLDHGGPGVYVTTPRVAPDAADVTILSRLRSANPSARELTALAVINDARGKRVASLRTPLAMAAGATSELRQTLLVPSPHLWNGRSDPYLYTVTVTLSDAGRVIDRVTQPLGIRNFRFDANKGFFLNGRSLPLRGVSRHQDWLGKGYAISDAEQDRDMAIIAEMGANTVRGAHYPHADRWYDLADRRGMVMWAEVPYISASSFDGSEGTPATFANAKQQMIELIRQQYNHPSIMTWSAGNEVDASMLFLKIEKPAAGLALLKATNEVAKTEDPSRPTVFADCCEDTPFGRKGQQKLTGVTDLIGYNRYYGWYYGTPADNGPELDKLHAKYPGTPISVSEYGAGGAISQHTDNPEGGPVAAFGRPHPEEYESWTHEGAYNAFKVRPYIFATWLWNMFDFASDLREEGDAIDMNDKGLVTYDRKTRKDAFYFYQANWSDVPMIHLTGRRYVERAYRTTDIRAYSNAARATLMLNGRRIGEADCPDRVCVWNDVQLAAGANEVKVTAAFKGQVVSDLVRWTGPSDEGIRLRAGTLTGGKAADGRVFGSDTWFTGGSAITLNPAIPGMKAPPRHVTGTSDPWMFESFRSGASRYSLPVPDGRWKLIIHSFEPNASLVDSRTFGVKVDGRLALDGFAPGKEAGGVMKAVSREIPVVVSNGRLSVEFVEQGGAPLVAAIELRRQ